MSPFKLIRVTTVNYTITVDSIRVFAIHQVSECIVADAVEVSVFSGNGRQAKRGSAISGDAVILQHRLHRPRHT